MLDESEKLLCERIAYSDGEIRACNDGNICNRAPIRRRQKRGGFQVPANRIGRPIKRRLRRACRRDAEWVRAEPSRDLQHKVVERLRGKIIQPDVARAVGVVGFNQRGGGIRGAVDKCGVTVANDLNPQMHILNTGIREDVKGLVQYLGVARIELGDHMPVERGPGIAATVAEAPTISASYEQHTIRAGRIAAQPDPAIGDLINVQVNGKVLQDERKPGKRGREVVRDGGIIGSASRRPVAAQVAPLGGRTKVKIVGKDGLRANGRHQNH